MKDSCLKDYQKLTQPQDVSLKFFVKKLTCDG